MNTTENNKLIAEFMGIVFTKDNKANHPRIKAPYPPIECFKYHSDWNWLMEVVKKIKSIETAKIIGITYYDDWEVVINEALISTNIDKLYNICISFIEWYNKQK